MRSNACLENFKGCAVSMRSERRSRKLVAAVFPAAELLPAEIGINGCTGSLPTLLIHVLIFSPPSTLRSRVN
jgi:hypothetical protein